VAYQQYTLQWEAPPILYSCLTNNSTLQQIGEFMEQQNNEPVNLFWTGGWDSTFRLLQLLIQQSRKIQPYYIIDPDRLSTGAELNAMQNIKRHVFAQKPQTREYLLPTIFKELIDIPPNPELVAAYERIKKHSHIGIQYDWLARFCDEIGIKGIELCFIRGGSGSQILKPFLVRLDSDGEPIYTVSELFHGSDEYELFHFYRFPVITLTKLDEQNIARNEGFFDLLSLSWFCHKPLANLQPCGVCTPCRIAIEAGLGWRIPRWSHIRYYLYTFIKRSKLLSNIWYLLKK
jgi:hypothetical protein